MFNTAVQPSGTVLLGGFQRYTTGKYADTTVHTTFGGDVEWELSLVCVLFGQSTIPHDLVPRMQ